MTFLEAKLTKFALRRLTFILPQSLSVTQHRYILIRLVMLFHQLLECDQQRQALHYVAVCLLKHYCNCNEAYAYVGHTVTIE
jgi:hypothetical protein